MSSAAKALYWARGQTNSSTLEYFADPQMFNFFFHVEKKYFWRADDNFKYCKVTFLFPIW